VRSLVIYFTGGTEATINTDQEPEQVFAALTAPGEWLVVTDVVGELHYLAKSKISYLTFGSKKGIGFA